MVCSFGCVPCLDDPGLEPPTLFFCEGTCPGQIASGEAGTVGFGYDPVFVEESTGKTFAELEATEKNQLSHRGQALREFRQQFARLCKT